MPRANPSSTERRALLDVELGSPAEFARRNLAWAAEHGHDRVIWHFATKEVVRDLTAHPGLESVATRLARSGRTAIQGIEVVVATRRLNASRGGPDAPLAAWWPTDWQLLELDSTRRPLLDALISNGWRAPVWLTANGVELGVSVGVRDPRSPIEDHVVPIVVSAELQEAIESRSRAINMTNGVHDSLAGGLVSEARLMIRNGSATPEAVATAALRAGWPPAKVPDLWKKL